MARNDLRMLTMTRHRQSSFHGLGRHCEAQNAEAISFLSLIMIRLGKGAFRFLRGQRGVSLIEAIKTLDYATSYPTAGQNIAVSSQYSVVVTLQRSSDTTNFVSCIGSDNETFQNITVSVSREGRPVFYLCSFRTKR